jgi:hypothetical protein
VFNEDLIEIRWVRLHLRALGNRYHILNRRSAGKIMNQSS